jgi:hypothetical protein
MLRLTLDVAWFGEDGLNAFAPREFVLLRRNPGRSTGHQVIELS